MYINLTEDQILDHFHDLSREEILEWLMDEGLELKATPKLSWLDVPNGVYRRKDGLDMIRFHGGNANWLDQHNDGIVRSLDGIWVCGDSTDEWVQVLDNQNRPVRNGFEFTVNEKGVRIA